MTDDSDLKLAEANRLVLQVAAMLNTNDSLCECCGRTTYENWTEAQAAVELAAAAGKIERWRQRLLKESP